VSPSPEIVAARPSCAIVGCHVVVATSNTEVEVCHTPTATVEPSCENAAR
jgi:hypothetical protein